MDGLRAAPGRRLTRLGFSALVIAALGALALTGAVTAAVSDKETIHLTDAGQAAARAAVLTRADLGTASGWTGGAKKPDLSSTPPCPNFDPKQSDLTLNGVAQTVFTHPGLQFDSEAQVLQTPQMVKLDWQRSVLTPQLLPCLRTGLAKALGSAAKVVSVQRVAFPKLATYAAAFRVVMDVSASGTTLRMMSDIVLVGRGRTELTLTTTALLAAKATVWPAEVRLARLLLTRVSA